MMAKKKGGSNNSNSTIYLLFIAFGSVLSVLFYLSSQIGWAVYARQDEEDGVPWVKTSRVLVACTTLNHWKVTRELIKTVEIVPDKFDFVIFDDASTDDTPKLARELGYTVIENPGMKGVTYTWNYIYSLFREMRYDFLFIINNDVLLPDGAVDAMVRDLEMFPEVQMIGPMTTVKGMGLSIGGRDIQTIEHHRPDLAHFVNQLPEYGAIQTIQAAVSVDIKRGGRGEFANLRGGASYTDMITFSPRGILGFFLGMSAAGAEQFQLDANTMFWSDNPLLGQEQDLFNPPRNIRAYVSKHAFVYHAKGTTVKVTDCLVQGSAAQGLAKKDSNSARAYLLAAYHGKASDGSALDCPEDDDDGGS